VLKDEDLRKKYDKYGEKGLQDEQQGGRYESWNYYRYDFGNLVLHVMFYVDVISLQYISKCVGRNAILVSILEKTHKVVFFRNL